MMKKFVGKNSWKDEETLSGKKLTYFRAAGKMDMAIIPMIGSS
jgi:hypothetical protein